jgi:hypothetical protein
MKKLPPSPFDFYLAQNKACTLDLNVNRQVDWLRKCKRRAPTKLPCPSKSGQDPLAEAFAQALRLMAPKGLQRRIKNPQFRRCLKSTIKEKYKNKIELKLKVFRILFKFLRLLNTNKIKISLTKIGRLS